MFSANRPEERVLKWEIHWSTPKHTGVFSQPTRREGTEMRIYVSFSGGKDRFSANRPEERVLKFWLAAAYGGKSKEVFSQPTRREGTEMVRD